MFQRFEQLVHPYPDAMPSPPPKTFFPFLWESTHGVRPYLLLLMVFTAAIGAFEALLFSMMAHVVDLLASKRYGRTPCVLSHRNAKKVFGGGLGIASGYGCTSCSKR